MALKDIWVDKVDDVDDVSAEDINAIAKQAIDNADAILNIIEGVPIVHADTDAYGDYFVESIEGVEDPLKIPLGTTICFVPGATSQSTQVRLGIGGTKDSPLVYYSIRRYLSIGTLENEYGATDDWLAINNPYIMSFNGSYWVVHGLTKPSAADLHSQVPVANGGTGGSTAENARKNLGAAATTETANAIVKTAIGRESITISDISPFAHPIKVTIQNASTSADTVEIRQDGVLKFDFPNIQGTLSAVWSYYEGGASELVFKATKASTVMEVTYNADTNAVVGDIETAVDTLIEQNETILSQQNSIIEMQNSLIGGDEE